MALKCKRVDIKTLYSYTSNSNENRRKEDSSVGIERRSGIERRHLSRYELDNSVKNDFNSVKNTYDKFINNSNKLLNDVNKFDNKTKNDDNKNNIAVATASLIPHCNKFMGVEEAFKDGDIIKTLGKWTIQLINIRADNIDLKDSYSQIKSRNFKIQDTQVPFSFIRNTTLEDSKSDLVQFLYKWDNSLFDTKPIRKVVDFCGIEYKEIETNKIDKFGNNLTGYRFKGNMVKKITGRALTRITLIGLICNILLELPSITKAENKKKQALKSTTNVTLMTACSAVLGAIGAYFGSVGSLAGIGLGIFAANKLSAKINNRY